MFLLRYYCTGGAKHRARSESRADDKGRGGVQPRGVCDGGGQGFCSRQSGAIGKYIYSLTLAFCLYNLYIYSCITNGFIEMLHDSVFVDFICFLLIYLPFPHPKCKSLEIRHILIYHSTDNSFYERL